MWSITLIALKEISVFLVVVFSKYNANRQITLA